MQRVRFKRKKSKHREVRRRKETSYSALLRGIDKDLGPQRSRGREKPDRGIEDQEDGMEIEDGLRRSGIHWLPAMVSTQQTTSWGHRKKDGDGDNGLVRQ